ncbi:hypothetical protein ACLOJK_031651 [Asimina triloba]
MKSCGRVARGEKRGKRGKKKKKGGMRERGEGEKEKRGRREEEEEEKKFVMKLGITDGAQQGVGAQTGIRCYKELMYIGDSLYPTAPVSGEMLPDFPVVVTAIG